MSRLTIGTRGSQLALWQANHVADRLRAHDPELKVELKIITTRGDRELDKPLPEIGGKGLFTEELEAALRRGEIDCAVHSLKDLPTEDPYGLIIGAMLQRASVEDVLISQNGCILDTLPESAIIGTSSRRRAAQLLYRRPDLRIADIRGNVPTRIEKAMGGAYDAIVLARAGLERLDLLAHVAQTLPLEVMLNAPGQGVLAVQCRETDAERFAPLVHRPTMLSAIAERAFLAALGGGCAVPVAAYGCMTENDMLRLHGRVSSVDGRMQIDVHVEGDASEAFALGERAAAQALHEGAGAILAEVGR
jgi:hydroxymethylbilane synthase